MRKEQAKALKPIRNTLKVRYPGYLLISEYARLKGLKYSQVKHAVERLLLPYTKVGINRLIHEDTPWLSETKKNSSGSITQTS